MPSLPRRQLTIVNWMLLFFFFLLCPGTAAIFNFFFFFKLLVKELPQRCQTGEFTTKPRPPHHPRPPPTPTPSHHFKENKRQPSQLRSLLFTSWLLRETFASQHFEKRGIPPPDSHHQHQWLFFSCSLSLFFSCCLFSFLSYLLLFRFHFQ